MFSGVLSCCYIDFNAFLCGLSSGLQVSCADLRVLGFMAFGLWVCGLETWSYTSQASGSEGMTTCPSSESLCKLR